MAIREADLERLREQVTATIARGTDLLAGLKSLDEGLAALMPSLARLPQSERDAFVARLCGYDPALPDHVRALIEGLADVVAGLTAGEGAQAWVRLHWARLEAGEASEAA